jgi:hypothetical protein
MKYLKIFVIVAILLLVNIGCRNKPNNGVKFQGAVDNNVYYEDSIKFFLNKFYKAWIKTNCNFYLIPTELLKERNSIQNIYCSRRLVKLLYDLTNQPILDWDPFLNSNMFDLTILKSIAINKDSVSANLFVVSYENGPSPIKIRLIISKEGPNYKIDSLPDIPLDMIKEVRPTAK